MAGGTRKGLSDLEHRVMRALWEHGACSTEEVRAALAPAKELADSTVRTLLHRLEVKGYVGHRAQGRSNVYEARVAPGDASTSAIRGVIQRFFHGSAESFLLGLVSQRILRPEDLAAAAAKLSEAREKPSGKKAGRP